MLNYNMDLSFEEDQDIGEVENTLFSQIKIYWTKFNLDSTKNCNAKNK